MTGDRFTDAASILFEARRTGRTIAALPDELKPGTFAEGYRVQDRLLDLDGRGIGLVKIGCTTTETQKIMNIAEPIAGCLPAEAIQRSGAVLAVERFHHPPLIECEFAMRLAADLDPNRPFDTVAEAIAATDAVAPALELVDGRFDNQLGIDGPSVVADNSMATMVVLGPAVEVGEGFEPGRLAATEVRLMAVDGDDGDEGDDAVIAEGMGSNVLGDPWRSFHWALRHVTERGLTIPAGTWMITGSCSGAPPAPLDRRLTARFEGLGDVSVTISSSAGS